MNFLLMCLLRLFYANMDSSECAKSLLVLAWFVYTISYLFLTLSFFFYFISIFTFWRFRSIILALRRIDGFFGFFWRLSISLSSIFSFFVILTRRGHILLDEDVCDRVAFQDLNMRRFSLKSSFERIFYPLYNVY